LAAAANRLATHKYSLDRAQSLDYSPPLSPLGSFSADGRMNCARLIVFVVIPVLAAVKKLPARAH
jgi:hypothetical protein